MFCGCKARVALDLRTTATWLFFPSNSSLNPQGHREETFNVYQKRTEKKKILCDCNFSPQIRFAFVEFTERPPPPPLRWSRSTTVSTTIPPKFPSQTRPFRMHPAATTPTQLWNSTTSSSTSASAERSVCAAASATSWRSLFCTRTKSRRPIRCCCRRSLCSTRVSCSTLCSTWSFAQCTHSLGH